MVNRIMVDNHPSFIRRLVVAMVVNVVNVLCTYRPWFLCASGRWPMKVIRVLASNLAVWVHVPVVMLGFLIVGNALSR